MSSKWQLSSPTYSTVPNQVYSSQGALALMVNKFCTVSILLALAMRADSIFFAFTVLSASNQLKYSNHSSQSTPNRSLSSHLRADLILFVAAL